MHRSSIRHVLVLVAVVFSMALAASPSHARPNLGDPEHSRVIVTMTKSKQGCVPSFTATGFAPDTTYKIAGYYGEGGQQWITNDGWNDIDADETGEASGKFTGAASIDRNLSFTVIIGGISSQAVPFTC